MKKLNKFFLTPVVHGRTIIVFLMFICVSYCCKPKNTIELEKVTSTSNNLECSAIFSTSRKAIVEINEILIQIGTIDSLEDASPNAAVIRIHGKDLFLNLVKDANVNGSFKRTYAGND